MRRPSAPALRFLDFFPRKACPARLNVAAFKITGATSVYNVTMSESNPAWLEALRHAELFHDLSAADLAKIYPLARTRQVERDAFFFHQGDAADLFYVLMAGQVKLTQLTSDGNQQLMRLIQPGEMFGGIAALGNATYPASAQAAQDSTALTWHTDTILQLMETHPRVALNTIHHLAQRVQELQQRNLELATERVERRIAHVLLRLVRASGRKAETGILIDFPLSRQDIAEMSGTTLYTVSRTLNAWQQKGLVEIGRERVLICNPHGLVAIAEDLTLPPHA